MDKIPAPTVRNVLKHGNFTLNIMAYRKLTEQELNMVAREVMRQNNLKRLPNTGTLTAYTSIGASE